jgi:predicted transcriptional regulator
MTGRRYGPVLESRDVKKLLRAEIEMAGGQTAFSRKHRVSRVTLNKIMQGKRPLTKSLIKSLKLRAVYVRQ